MTKTWFRAASIRATKTMAQAAVATIGSGAIGLFDVNWLTILSVSAMAGVTSLLTSIAGLPEVEE